MTDRPILFSPPMVRALLAGTKTMTRRMAWRWPKSFGDSRPIVGTVKQHGEPTLWQKAKPGDRLWVRERTTCTAVSAKNGGKIMVMFDADGCRPSRWYPFPERMQQVAEVGQHLSMGCYREISRLTLVLTSTKIERVQDITEEDAGAEGIVEIHRSLCLHGRMNGYGVAGTPPEEANSTRRAAFCGLWLHLRGREAWQQNPELVAMTFTVHHTNIDTLPLAA